MGWKTRQQSLNAAFSPPATFLTTEMGSGTVLSRGSLVGTDRAVLVPDRLLEEATEQLRSLSRLK